MLEKREAVGLLDVETDVVSGDTLLELLVVHLDGLDFSGHTDGG